MVGVGGRLWSWQGKVRMWSYLDPLALLIETGAGHKYPLSIGYVFVVVKFHLGSNQTAVSRRVTGSGVLGHEVSEKGKGCRCLSFCSMDSLLKQEQGITICYRLCTGVSWVKNQSGDEKDRLGRKGYHGGCGGTLMDLAEKSTNVVVF